MMNNFIFNGIGYFLSFGSLHLLTPLPNLFWQVLLLSGIFLKKIVINQFLDQSTEVLDIIWVLLLLVHCW